MPRIDRDPKLDFDDVLIRPKRSTLQSREEVILERTYRFRNSGQEWTGVPIIASNMDTVGTFKMAVAFAPYKMLVAIHKYYSLEEWREFAEDHPDVLPHVIVSGGISEEDFAFMTQVLEEFETIRFACLDVANGYQEKFVDAVKRFRLCFPDRILIAGNVVTHEMVEELLLAGADVVKVGIGNGAVCTTRKMTGVGYPQLSAVIECADAAHGLEGHVISDGGLVVPGDLAKAFGGGADFIMSGSLFAGHSESGGERVEENGETFLSYYGMSSKDALEKYHGGRAYYRAPEGKKVMVPFKGNVKWTIEEILGGLRSACSYVGARRLKELSKRTTFIIVGRQRNVSLSSE